MVQKETLYHKVENDIMAKIESGVYQPGDFMPTETQMCQEYNVSRVTIRTALEHLIEKGVIERSFSKTPHIKNTAVPRNINRWMGLSEDLEQDGVRCSTFLLGLTEIQADADLAQHLGVPEGEPLYEIERIRYANGSPLGYQHCYLTQKCAPGLTAEKLNSRPLYRLLEQEYHLHIAYARQTLSAVTASYRICALLEIKNPVAMLKVRNVGYLQNEECFEFSENYYIGDHYEVSVMLER